MKKTILFVVVGLFLMAGAVYAASAVKTSETMRGVEVEMPDKDPKAKGSDDTAKKSCCSDKKADGKCSKESCCKKEASCKGEKKSCDGAKKAEGKSCGDKKEASTTSTETKTNCPRTKCQ
jgi:hypothetical protein